MNRTLLSAVLVIALSAINCFAAETQQVQTTAASPGASLPVASQALANPGPLPQPVPKAEAAAKSSPIVEAGSQQDGIPPQKSQLEDSTFPQQAATAPGAPAEKPCASCNKTTSGGHNMRIIQTAPNTSSAEPRKLGMSTGTGIQQGGCQTCKKKTVTSGDGTTGTETTK